MTSTPLRVTVAAVAVAALLFALVATWVGGVSTGAGEVAVVRNGGPWDDREIREDRFVGPWS